MSLADEHIETIRTLAAHHFSDEEIAAHLGVGKHAVYFNRRKHGIPAGVSQGSGNPSETPCHYGFAPGNHEARYAAFFAEQGRYPDYDAADTARERRRYQARRARLGRAA